jgi:hypothetical protein
MPCRADSGQAHDYVCAMPEQLDVLFVSGGVPGAFTKLEYPQLLTFINDKDQPTAM